MSEEPDEIPTQTPELEEGTRTLFTQAESKEEAIANVQATSNDLEGAGVESSVEYVGIDIPEEKCVIGEGAVHEVKLIIEEDHMVD
jgi:hypothetical protein